MYATPDTALDPNVGQINEPIDEEGVKQANALAEELRRVEFDVIISSTLLRAFQTAKILNKYHKLNIVVDDVWRERDTGGYLAGEDWNKLFNFDKNISVKNVEKLQSFFKRVYTALDGIKDTYGDKTVMIVSHGGVHQALYAYANKLPLEGNTRNSPLDNCEYKIYEL